MGATTVRIDRITTAKSEHRLSQPYWFGPERVDAVTTVTVSLVDDQGRTGTGETLCLPGSAGTGAASIEETILHRLAPAIQGLSPLERTTIHRSLEDAEPGAPLARAAIDLAVHDLAGKILEVPTLLLLGGTTVGKIPLVHVLPDGELDEVVEAAAAAQERGLLFLKLLVGEDPDKDLEVVAKVRERVGPEMRLRVGCRAAYSLVTATRVLRQMEEYGLELVEQPLPPDNVEGLAELTSHLDTPVLVTLCNTTPSGALEVICRNAANILGINAMQSGGLLDAVKIAHMAQAASMALCVVGFPVGPVGTSADVQLASAVGASDFAAEIPGPGLLSPELFQDSTETRSAPDGFLTVPDRPGL